MHLQHYLTISIPTEPATEITDSSMKNPFYFQIIILKSFFAECWVITKNRMLKEFRDWGNVFHIEFTIEVTKVPETEWVNAFHFTANGNDGKIGYRIPALFIKKDGYFQVCSAVSGNQKCKNYYFELGKRYHIVIEQSWYWYQISIDGNSILNIENSQPRSFSYVKLYASNPWASPFSADLGSICNVKVRQGGELRDRFIRSTKVSPKLARVAQREKIINKS